MTVRSILSVTVRICAADYIQLNFLRLMQFLCKLGFGFNRVLKFCPRRLHTENEFQKQK